MDSFKFVKLDDNKIISERSLERFDNNLSDYLNDN